MRIAISGKGIHRREVPGVEKLRTLPAEWYAFTNLELIQPGEMPRQLDVIIVLDDRILIADLKDWRGKITSDGDRWFQNDRYVDTSPVKKILENARMLATLLSGFLRKNSGRAGNTFNRWELPLIEGCVILTNRCDISGVTDLEKPRVFMIDEFCRFIQKPRERASKLATPKWIDKANPLTAANSKWRGLFAIFFGASAGYFRPLEKRYGDYRVISDITYEHPKQLYSEFDAEEVTASRGSGLLRFWDFSKADARYASEEARKEIAGREQNVIAYLLDRVPELESVLIRPKISDSEKGIHYWEVFERRRQLRRVQEFLTVHSKELTPAARTSITRALLSHIAALHRLGAAHLDIGNHSIWLELPSSVRISHLVAASYPELTSLGERRFEFLGSGTLLPESVLGESLDHFRKDVFLLGVVIHGILFGTIPKSTQGNPPEWDPRIDTDGHFDRLHYWFAKALDVSYAQRFSDAQEMLDSFNEATKIDASLAIALDRLERFRKWKSAFELYRSYPVKEVLKENDRIVMWVSESAGKKVVIKAWRRVCWADEAQECPRILSFCQTAEELILECPAGIVELLDVGFISDHLVMIQEYIDAPTLADDLANSELEWKDGAVALKFISKLAGIVADLHEGGRAHGDIKPANIMVSKGESSRDPIIIDVVDFGPADEGEIRTPKYAPTYPVGKRERDRFAVLRVTEEILAVASIPDAQLLAVKAALNTSLNQSPQLATLAPLIEAAAKILRPPAPPRRAITLRSNTIPAGAILSDEGSYYVTIHSDTRVTLTGASEELAVRLNPRKSTEILNVHRRPIDQSKVALAEKRAAAHLDADILVVVGSQDYSELSEFLSSLQSTGITQEISLEPRGSEFSESDDVADSLEEDPLAEPAGEPQPSAEVDVPALWKTLVDVEGEQFTEGFADADSYYSRERRRQFVPFVLRKGTIDFTRDDKVLVEVPNRSMRWISIGVLDLDLTRADLLALDTSTFRAVSAGQLCSAGTELRLRSMMETDSRSRRNAATTRILARKSVIPNLVDYFDQRKELIPQELGVTLDIDSLKQTYGFNDSQAVAFRSLWNKRPLGLLQGPPGTGKTKFIAALIHHALSTGVARNVLLSSQSHEAVNNAAENVLALFRKENIEPSLIRVGQAIPPRLLSSIRKTPACVMASASISLTEPSSAMNSKFR
jgi:serine/threonine protein kinase